MPLSKIQNQISWLALLLLGGDIFFIGLHGLGYFYLPFSIEILSLESDRSLPEFFQYFKEFFAAIMFWLLARRSKDRAYLSICILFTYVLLDDAFSFHERVGLFLGDALSLKDGFIRANDIGELLVSAISGFFIFGFIGYQYIRSNTYFRHVVHEVVILFGLLAFFGVGVDMLHSACMHIRYIAQLLAMLEDGGEMLTVSLIAAYALLLYQTWPREEPLFSLAISRFVKRGISK